MNRLVILSPRFQSTLPRGERHLWSTYQSPSPAPFQSTLPRGERPRGGRDRHRILSISIHAPARGATPRTVRLMERYSFQSTLPRGERLGRDGPAPGDQHFNPRSREGSDLSVFFHPYRFGYFNPRSREGSDLETGTCGLARSFQSTLPRGERHFKAACEALCRQLFQSTLPRGERRRVATNL